jgi:hypothetical protein
VGSFFELEQRLQTAAAAAARAPADAPAKVQASLQRTQCHEGDTASSCLRSAKHRWHVLCLHTAVSSLKGLSTHQKYTLRNLVSRRRSSDIFHNSLDAAGGRGGGGGQAGAGGRV